jgi:tRNA nucleotidyltransferase (CCA-adding enzyme)
VLRPTFANVPVPEAVLDVVSQLQQKGHPTYLVGGCVRDALMGKKPKDHDIATSARPERVMEIFKHTVPTGLRFGTVTVLSRPDIREGGEWAQEAVEVTTFRGDGTYSDSRHPDSVMYTDDIEADLARRDFTINAMAWDPIARKLIDPFGGQADLTHEIIRCVGDPVLRFREDNLRVLRALRFGITLGFDIEQNTVHEMENWLGWGLGNVAAERRSAELLKCLVAPFAETGLEAAFRYTPGLKNAFSLSHSDAPLEFKGMASLPEDPVLRTALMLVHWPLPDIGTFCRGLRLEGKFLYELTGLVHALQAIWERPPATDADVRRLLASALDGGVNISELLALLHASGAHDFAAQIQRVWAIRPALSLKDLALGGDDVIRITGATGPRIGELLQMMLDVVLDDPNKNTAERLTQLLAPTKET